MCRMVTGGWLIASVQAASQGAGQTLPVISGRLHVECRRVSALRHCFRCTMSFQSGIRFTTGHPNEWQ